MCTLIKRKPGFSGKMFWSLEVPFKIGFAVLSQLINRYCCFECVQYSHLQRQAGSRIFTGRVIYKKHFVVDVLYVSNIKA
jgi:hypothetical protein